MIHVWKTRLMQLKKRWLSIAFWAILPFLLTWIVLETTEVIQDESKIPVGIVLKENTEMAHLLKENLQSSTFVDVLDITETEAKQMVATHEIDSAFVIEKGYEEAILNGERNRLISSYTTNFSFGYVPIREMIGSFVQEDSGKAKAAQTILQLGDYLNVNNLPTTSEIIEKVQEVEISENLVYTSFQFQGENATKDNNRSYLFDPWQLWGVFALLSTLLIFDWVIRDRNHLMQSRFAFIRYSFKHYMLSNVIFYILFLYIIDLLTAIGFHYLFQDQWQWKSIFVLLGFRVLITIISFLIALCFQRYLIYYSFVFSFVLIVFLISGIIIPIEGLTQLVPWINVINPMYAFSEGELWHPLFILSTIFLVLWYMKGEK
ncbi:ABC transporter permease [Oceanobacillus sp. 1P07AA]|uniref:ABC transporter permease n=1 Tax=Oceanobacillus sp. 1P07AA TaxID=3132293 RepID=UPI0039A58C26